MDKYLTVLFLALVSCSFGPYESDQLSYKSYHFSISAFDEVRAKIEDSIYLNDYLQIKELADSMVKAKVEIPIIPSVWPHYYVDPEEGKPLIPGMYLGNWKWEHYSADRTKVYYSDPTDPSKNYDGVLILTKVHHGYANALLALSFMHKLNPRIDYLEKIQEILMAYAEVYQDIPLHDKQMRFNPDAPTGNGRIAAQALGESVWLCKVTQALDMVWEDIEPFVKTKTEVGLIRPAVEVIQASAATNHLKIHNIRCWYLAAVGSSGLLLEDTAFIKWSIHEDDYALNKQLDQGFTQDGLWYERAPSYHFYAITPIIYLVNAMDNRGFTNYKSRLETIIASYAKFAHPETLEVPRYNDSRSTILEDRSDFFYYANSMNGGEELAPLVNKIRENIMAKNETQSAMEMVSNDLQRKINKLIFDEQTSSLKAPFEVKSANYPTSGYAVFNHLNERNGIMLTVKYDGYDGDGKSQHHLHPDQLNFSVFWKNSLVFADPGHAEYGSAAQNGWYNTSLAHNTLVVDHRNQSKQPSTSLQYLTGEVNALVVGNDELYDGVSFTRGFWVVDDSTLVIVDKASSNEAHTYDLPMHPKGEMLTQFDGSPFELPEKGDGYNYLIDPKIKSGLTEFTFTTRTADDILTIDYLSNSASEIISGKGYGPDFEEVPVMIARKKSSEFLAVWILQFGYSSDDFNIEFSESKIYIEVRNQSLVFDKTKKSFGMK